MRSEGARHVAHVDWQQQPMVLSTNIACRNRGIRPATSKEHHLMESPAHQPRDAGSYRVEICPTTDNAQLAIYDSAVVPLPSPRILVLKLDHLGDFLIGVPAL